MPAVAAHLAKFHQRYHPRAAADSGEVYYAPRSGPDRGPPPRPSLAEACQRAAPERMAERQAAVLGAQSLGCLRLGGFPVVWVCLVHLCAAALEATALGAPQACRSPGGSDCWQAATRCGGRAYPQCGCLHLAGSSCRSSLAAAEPVWCAHWVGACFPAGLPGAAQGEQEGCRTACRAVAESGCCVSAWKGTGWNCGHYTQSCCSPPDPDWRQGGQHNRSDHSGRSCAPQPCAVGAAIPGDAVRPAAAVFSSYRSSGLAAGASLRAGSHRTGQSPPAAELSSAGAKIPEFYSKVFRTSAFQLQPC